jgi:hypothetical protein
LDEVFDLFFHSFVSLLNLIRFTNLQPFLATQFLRSFVAFEHVGVFSSAGLAVFHVILSRFRAESI